MFSRKFLPSAEKDFRHPSIHHATKQFLDRQLLRIVLLIRTNGSMIICSNSSVASLKGLLSIIDKKPMLHYPVIGDAVKLAHDIWGPSLLHLKGKTVRKTPGHVPTAVIQHVLSQILENYQEITLCADIIFVNKVRFLTTISRNLRFTTATHLMKADATTLLTAITQVVSVAVQLFPADIA